MIVFNQDCCYPSLCRAVLYRCCSLRVTGTIPRLYWHHPQVTLTARDQAPASLGLLHHGAGAEGAPSDIAEWPGVVAKASRAAGLACQLPKVPQNGASSRLAGVAAAPCGGAV